MTDKLPAHFLQFAIHGSYEPSTCIMPGLFRLVFAKFFLSWRLVAITSSDIFGDHCFRVQDGPSKGINNTRSHNKMGGLRKNVRPRHFAYVTPRVG